MIEPAKGEFMAVTITRRRDRPARSWVVTHWQDGKRVRKTFATEDEATAWAKAADEAHQGAAAWLADDAMPVNDVLRGWLETYRPTLARSTEETDSGLIDNHLAPYFGDRDLRSIAEADILAFAEWSFDRGKSAAVAKNALSLLRRVCSIYVREGLLPSNPALGVGSIVAKVSQRYQPPAEAVDSWAAGEVVKLLDAAEASEPHFFPMLLCMLHTGLRRGEVIALQWADIDFDRQTIHVRRAKVRARIKPPKSGKTRVVPMSDDLAGALRGLAKRRHEVEGIGSEPETVFRASNGRPWLERSVNRAFDRLRIVAAREGVRPLRLHCARHTFATLALEGGRSLRWVADVLGHADPTLTIRTYAHVMRREGDDMGFLPSRSATAPKPPPSASNEAGDAGTSN